MAQEEENRSRMATASDSDLVLSALASDGPGNGAVVESNRRLREAVVDAKDAILSGSRSIDSLTRRLIVLTWGLLGLTLVLVGIELWKLCNE
jgi:predicted naringenin-chalcone synthase